MLRSSSKTKMFGALVSLASLPVLCAVSASATEVTRNTNFRVNVSDALSVAVTTPDQWATGDPDEFLRNRINVWASTNNPAGLSAYMTTKTTNTSLVNTRKSNYTIPTLTESKTVANFPVNRWGYTLFDDELEPNNASIYNALHDGVSTGQDPIQVLQLNVAGQADQDVWFGAKADMTMASGTYANTVVISVVTGVIENDPTDPGYNPVPPVDPATPTTPDEPTYDPTNDRTTYTTVTPNQDDTTTTTTEVSNGDTRSSYQDPHGVKHKTSTTTNINEGNPLATGLAVTAAVAGATGFIFFLIGKRRKDEEEEEEGTGEQQPPVQG
jgi:hypothetical protein